jgi:hypothetical protein
MGMARYSDRFFEASPAEIKVTWGCAPALPLSRNAPHQTQSSVYVSGSGKLISEILNPAEQFSHFEVR